MTRSPGYQPVSRRPIAAMFRRTARGSTLLCARLGIHPDVISCSSIAVSAAAGLCFWRASAVPWLLLVGPLLCYLRLWLNMLDGMVALETGKASRRGELLNDLPDRASDVLVFVGVAHSGLAAVVSGYWVAIAALLVAYVGMFGQAVGVQREYSGIMAKPWRLVALHIGAWLTLGLIWMGVPVVGLAGLTVLDWTCLVIVVGSVQTIWLRLSRILRSLHAEQSREDA